jgi:CheY-like chemotaxis protein
LNSLITAPKRILIVDDDAQTRDGLALAIRTAGHTVRTAANGLEALKEVRVCRPDLIVLDLIMPTMDGWTFRTHQLTDPALADIPVVVLSGVGQVAAPEAERLGISNCFAKPSAAHEILEVMGDLFDVIDGVGMAQVVVPRPPA